MKKATTRDLNREQVSRNSIVHPYASEIQTLKKLAQPWNTVVRAAIGLLNCDEKKSLCEIKRKTYSYAEFVQDNGIWNCELSEHAKRSAICIVLKGRLEVVGLQPLPQAKSAGSFSAVRPAPYIAIEQGGIVGTYEFTGNLFQRPEKHDYQVMSGPVCLQFDHESFCSFHHVITEKSSLLTSGIKGLKKNANFIRWIENGMSYDLIKSIAEDSKCQEVHAEVLFIALKDPSDLKDDKIVFWEAFRNAVVENAWLQSQASRGRGFKSSNLDVSACDDIRVPEAHLAGTSATLVHINEVIHGVGAVWESIDDSINKYPAISSFLELLSENKIPLLGSHIFLQRSLLETGNGGFISVVDFIHRFEQKADGGYVKKDHGENRQTQQAKWALIDPFFSTQARFGGDKLESIHNYVNRWIAKGPLLREAWPAEVESIIPDNKSKNPFPRYRINIKPGLETFPIFEWIESKSLNGENLDLNGVLIVACQHFLRETCCWFSHLLKAGATIIAMGKDYSTCPEVAERLRRIGVTIIERPEWSWKPGGYKEHFVSKINQTWEEASKVCIDGSISEIIVLDDGGFLMGAVPKSINLKISGVEQTTSGMPSANEAAKRFPVVCVADSSKKRRWESPMIAEAIAERAKYICPLLGAGAKVGVIGSGAIGAALLNQLKVSKDHKGDDLNYQLFYYDVSGQSNISHNVASAMPCIAEVIKQSSVIFGCTGNDFLSKSGIDLSIAAGKWFISCGSMDTEFLTLLLNGKSTSLESEFQRPHNPFSTVVVHVGTQPCFVANGGFPVNFDRRRDSVPLQKIQLTRGLMHSGLIQARSASNSTKKPIPLDFFSTDDELIPNLQGLLGFCPATGKSI